MAAAAEEAAALIRTRASSAAAVARSPASSAAAATDDAAEEARLRMEAASDRIAFMLSPSLLAAVVVVPASPATLASTGRASSVKRVPALSARILAALMACSRRFLAHSVAAAAARAVDDAAPPRAEDADSTGPTLRLLTAGRLPPPTARLLLLPPLALLLPVERSVR